MKIFNKSYILTQVLLIYSPDLLPSYVTYYTNHIQIIETINLQKVMYCIILLYFKESCKQSDKIGTRPVLYVELAHA